MAQQFSPYQFLRTYRAQAADGNDPVLFILGPEKVTEAYVIPSRSVQQGGAEDKQILCRRVYLAKQSRWATISHPSP